MRRPTYSEAHSGVTDSDPLPAVYTAQGIQDTVSRLANDLDAGKIHPSVAGTMATLLNLQLRAIEAKDLEDQIAKLQRQVAETTRKRVKFEGIFQYAVLPSYRMRVTQARYTESFSDPNA